MPAQAFRWTNPPENFNFSGPEALRSYFFPRQTIQLQEAARVIGIGREALYKRQWRGDFALKISRRPGGRQFILLDDLIDYLFPSSQPENLEIQATSPENYTNGVAEERKKPGRPRGSKNKPSVPTQKGGAK